MIRVTLARTEGASAIFGYSKLLIEESRERINQLTEIVLATNPASEGDDEPLVRLRTDDKTALVFHSVKEPDSLPLPLKEATRNSLSAG